MEDKYHALLDKLEPYVVIHHRDALDESKALYGKQLNQNYIFDPLKLQSQNFIEKIYKVDELSFGGQSMGMDKWVFLNCSVMPGFAFGYGIDAARLSDKDQAFLNASGFTPLSLYIAIPTLKDNIWLGHNLSSLNGKLELDLSGLGLLTKLSAMNLFGIKKLQGATQWNSVAIKIHSKIAPMKLLSAYTPIHTHPNTLCYLQEVEEYQSQLVQSSKREQKNFIVGPDSLLKLQAEIEQGREVSIKYALNKQELFLI